MLKAKRKQIQDDKIQRELLNCGHEVQIDRLNQSLASREEDIRKIRDRMAFQIKAREREINNTTEKINQSKVELRKAQKKGGHLTESERIA